jgi:hypothetical protein
MTTAWTRLRPRAALSVLALAATLALAACGGGSAKKDGGDYRASLNAFCGTIERGAKQVQKDTSSVTSGSTKSDPQGSIKKLGASLGTFATTIDGGLTKLRKADVPDEYRTFNRGVVDGFGLVVTRLRSASKQAAKGDPQPIRDIGTTLRDVKLPTMPKALTDAAPSCVRISS